MTTYRNSIPVHCSICGQLRHPVNMAKHQRNKSCVLTGKARAMQTAAYEEKRARGFVRLSHASFLSTIESAGLTAERGLVTAGYFGGTEVAVTEGWWVPDWVEAIVSARNLHGGKDGVVKASTEKRVKALQLARVNPEFRDALHTLIMLTPAQGASAVSTMLKKAHKERQDASCQVCNYPSTPVFTSVADAPLPL